MLCLLFSLRSFVAKKSAPLQSPVLFILHPSSFILSQKKSSGPQSADIMRIYNTHQAPFCQPIPPCSANLNPFPALFRPQKRQQLKLYKTEGISHEHSTDSAGPQRLRHQSEPHTSHLELLCPPNFALRTSHFIVPTVPIVPIVPGYSPNRRHRTMAASLPGRSILHPKLDHPPPKNHPSPPTRQ